jgi:ribosome-binding protein aMBF1 (putative translation factor)
MPPSLAHAPAAVLSSDRRRAPRLPVADLRKAENAAGWLVLGQAMDRTRQARGLSVKEFATKVKRNEAQVRRWFAGKERPQADVVFAVKEFQQPFVIALAKAAAEGVKVVTEIRLEMSA